MTSLVAKASLGLSSVMRKMGTTLDKMGKGMEITKYTEKLVPSTRFVAVDGVGPTVSEQSFVAPSASVIGDVTIGKTSSVWYGAILRGDVNALTVGDNSSIGDRAVVHVAKIQGDFPTHIGNNVTIRAGALIHAATLKDAVVIGESAQVLDGATIESFSMIGPASIVTPGTKIGSGEYWMGSPAKKVRDLSQDEKDNILLMASETASLAEMHAEETGKSYEQIMEEAEVADIKMHLDESAPQAPIKDMTTVLGQGKPGRIFRSTLSHPEDVYQQPPTKE